MKKLEDICFLFTTWDYERGMYSQDDMRLVLLGQLGKMTEELGELAKNINRNDLESAKDDIGDCLKVLNTLSNLCGHTLADCAEHTLNEIKDRKGEFVGGVYVKESDL